MMSLTAVAMFLFQVTTAPSLESKQLAAKAAEARAAGRMEEAIRLYQQTLKLNPKWEEGWFLLGSIQYDLDHGPECAVAFRKFTVLQPKVSAGHAFLGLCLFQVKEYAASLQSLLQARRLGMPKGQQLTDVASYHAALLYIKEDNFERALQILHTFLSKGEMAPKVIEAAGIAALRRPILPQELPVDDRELVYRIGRATMTALDRRASEAAMLFQDIVRDFPNTPNVHYVYATFLIGGDADQALVELKKELELQPKHLPSLVLLALEYLKRGDPGSAKPFAMQAVISAPKNFTAHVVMGRAMLGLDDVAGAVKELELAVKLEPTSPQTRIALASAYQRAGNPQEAAKHRAEFQRLKKLLEQQGDQ